MNETKAITTRKQAISGAPKMLSVAHGVCATVSSPLKCVFCGAPRYAPQKAQVSVAHCTACATEKFQWRIALACATEMHAPQKQKCMRHRIICRYSEIAAACCINTGILQEIRVYIQDLYRYNRNNNIFDTVYENRHITWSPRYINIVTSAEYLHKLWYKSSSIMSHVTNEVHRLN